MNRQMLQRPTITRSLACHTHLLLRAGASALVAILLAGCQGINPSATSVAQLRIIQASPDAGALDAYQNATGLAYNLGFGTITSYVAMSPGGYALTASRAGTRQTMVSGNATMLPDHAYTMVVGNIAANLQQTVYQDQTQPAPAGEVEVRLLNQATRPGPVDVYLVPVSGKLPNTSPVIAGMTFGTNSGYLTVPAGTYALAVVPAGTVPVATTATLYSGAQLAYAGGLVRTVVLIDVPTSPILAVQPIFATDVDATN